MDENEWAEFFFDSDVALAMMEGKTYEEAVEEAKQNLRYDSSCPLCRMGLFHTDDEHRFYAYREADAQ